MSDLSLLQRLCEAHGISGSEDAVRKLILEEIGPHADSVEVSPLGNIIVFKKGTKRPQNRLMISAHMDEVGMIVTRVTDDGLLKFAPVGGIDRRVLCGRSVTVNDTIPGVIGAKPIHLLKDEERGKSVPWEDLYIDIGAADRAEAERYALPGDPVCFDSVFDSTHGMVKSRALDDRTGCAILISMIQSDLPYDLFFTFVVQEEIGLHGAKTAAYTVQPDAAIVVETTTAADVAGVKADLQVCRVGGGPVLSFMDRHTIYDREYYRMAFSAAKQMGIKCQAKQAVSGGNGAGTIHVSRSGVRTIAVSLPCRYQHSAVGMISQEDYAAAQKLIPALAEEIAGGTAL